jgi:hypothetical protein
LRKTRYPATRTLSRDLLHAIVIVVREDAAMRWLSGTVGAERSRAAGLDPAAAPTAKTAAIDDSASARAMRERTVGGGGSDAAVGPSVVL